MYDHIIQSIVKASSLFIYKHLGQLSRCNQPQPQVTNYNRHTAVDLYSSLAGCSMVPIHSLKFGMQIAIPRFIVLYELAATSLWKGCWRIWSTRRTSIQISLLDHVVQKISDIDIYKFCMLALLALIQHYAALLICISKLFDWKL